ncbi:hypothetical protein RD792_012298 [Penstemon davidsonii]|uniref:Peptidase S8/S53 domain-containing protein n=1 Tax=Penstemon davidsonii TaxID=160366 RepID=A0ABR0CXV3_9LAMI|nr:hypothetical protein RD792_012298 [Penstemon davidsonii]
MAACEANYYSRDVIRPDLSRSSYYSRDAVHADYCSPRVTSNVFRTGPDSEPVSQLATGFTGRTAGIWARGAEFLTDDDVGPGSITLGVEQCMEGRDFSSSNCNRDDLGHGTHVASTAAGRQVSNSAYYDLAEWDGHRGDHRLRE